MGRYATGGTDKERGELCGSPVQRLFRTEYVLSSRSVYPNRVTVKALGRTPILSPSTPMTEHLHTKSGSKHRDLKLRPSCLIRDGHRCIVSQKFDVWMAMRRTRREGQGVRDDDGLQVTLEERDILQVCHIIPYSLTSNPRGEVSESKVSDKHRASGLG